MTGRARLFVRKEPAVFGRVGVHIAAFEACSSFTRVTAPDSLDSVVTGEYSSRRGAADGRARGQTSLSTRRKNGALGQEVCPREPCLRYTESVSANQGSGRKPTFLLAIDDF